MKKAMAVPVSEWGPGMAVSLFTVARRWGLSEGETLELFGLIPSIGNDVDKDGEQLYDGDVTICVAETGKRLWMAPYILSAEKDMPDLASGRGQGVLVALRTLESAVEGIAPGMYHEVVSDITWARGCVTA
jgi:hypothetical protein